MDQDQVKALFDRQAAGYDAQWARVAAIRDGLHLLLDAQFAALPAEARILCVGLGTGAELAFLAERHPGWRFTAVEPSGAMLAQCRRRAEDGGFVGRCEFHEGYLASLPGAAAHDAATCLLVSQFMLDRVARTAFFADIAARLKPEGMLVSTDLAGDVASPAYDVLLRAWIPLMTGAEASAEAMARMRRAYVEDVALLPPDEVAALLVEGGFELPVRFFQAGLIHGWVSRRRSV
jgi:tRNA (cmo5U34)-methyltransferase